MASLRNLEKSFRALGNQRRLAMVSFLKKYGTATVGDLAKAARLTIQAASKHLQIMEAAGIVTSRKKGLYVEYRLLNRQPTYLKMVVKEL